MRVNIEQFRRLCTTKMAQVFMILWICHLILADHREAVTGYTSDIRTAQIDVTTPKEEIWKSKQIIVKNLTENKSSLTTIEERKMLAKQNKSQEPFNVTDNGISDLGLIKERITIMEENLADLRQLYCEEGQAIRRGFKNFYIQLRKLRRTLKALTDQGTSQFISLYSLISNKTEAQMLQNDQLLTRINDLVNNFKFHLKLQPDIADFQEAMVVKNIPRAAVHFNKIINQNESINFIKDSYEVVNNFDCFMELAKLLDQDKQSQIYSIIQEVLLQKFESQEVLLQKHESYADICHLGILSLKMKDLTYGYDENIPSEELDDSYVADDSLFDTFYEWIREPILVNITNNISTRLQPLLMRHHHIDVSLMVIGKPYFDSVRVIYILPDSSERQAFHCEKNQLRLDEDNYVAPLDSC